MWSRLTGSVISSAPHAELQGFSGAGKVGSAIRKDSNGKEVIGRNEGFKLGIGKENTAGKKCKGYQSRRVG